MNADEVKKKANCFMFHSWSRWERVRQAIIDVKHPEIKLSELYQERECLKCGKIQRESL